jgi:translation initiation factor IF-2
LRIYQAAQHLGVTSKDLLDLLKAQGVDVKSPSSTVDESTFLMAEQLLNAAAAAPPEPVRPKVAEPAPIPTKAGKVGSIPPGQKSAKGKADSAETLPAAPGETSEDEAEATEPSAVPETPVEVRTDDVPPPAEEPPEEERPAAAPPIRRAPQPTGPIPVAQKGLRTMGGGNLPPRPTAAGAAGAARRPRETGMTRPGSSSLATPPSGSTLGRPPVGGVRPGGPRRPDPSAQRPVMTYDEMMKERQRLAQAKTAVAPGAPTTPSARPAPGGRRPGSFDDDQRKGKKSVKDARGGQRLDKRQLDRLSSGDDGEYRPWRKKQHHASAVNRPAGPVVLDTPITVRSFSAAAGITAKDIQTRLF